MKQTSWLRRCAVLAAVACGVLASADSGSYSATNSSITGLYDSYGLLTSSCNVESVTYTLSYDTYVDWIHSTLYYYAYNHGTPSACWPTKLVFHFSNNGWQSYKSTASVWVQVCNYIISSDQYGNATVSSEHSYFKQPNPYYTPLFTWSSGSFHADLDPTHVLPEEIPLSWLTVDTSDSTGKTGYVSWNATSSGTPWEALPTSETVQWASYPTTGYAGVVWLFPDINQNGKSSGNVSAYYTYPFAQTQ